MSMISDLVDKLRVESKSMGKYGTDYMATLLMQASDTIVMLSEKARADRPNGKWIPCSERLPEKEGWYITTVEGEKTGRRRIENDLFAVDIALAHGHTPNKFCKDGYRQRTVAWMPFPEPYREVE